MRGDSTTNDLGQGPSTAGLRHQASRRGLATTTRLRGLVGLLGLIGITACDPPVYFDSPQPVGNGKVAVSWTLNGAELTSSTCTAEKISWMRVTILSRNDERLGAEFLNVACALDRYSAAMTPNGPVRIIVDAVLQSGKSGCIRYTGFVDTQATTQFPTTPAAIQLKPLSGCP